MSSTISTYITMAVAPVPMPSYARAMPGRRRSSFRLVALAPLALLLQSPLLAVDALSLHRPTSRRRSVARAHPNVASPRPPPPRWSSPLYQSTAPAADDGPPAAPPSTDSRTFGRDLSVPAVLLAAFLNLLGFTMASPIQPALGRHFALPLGASFGSLSSAYPLGMFLGVFLWPTLSDVLGRKSVMGLTLAGSGVGLALQSWGILRGWTLEQFLAARVLTGCFAGNSPISKAYLADRGAEGKRGDLTRYLAWKDAASTLAFIVGPVLGGLVYQLFGRGVVDGNSRQISCVILCSAMASMLASASIMLFVKNTKKNKIHSYKVAESKNDEANAASTPREATKDEGVTSPTSEIVSCPLGTKLWTGVATVACVSALYHAADSALFAFFPSLLQNSLGFDTQAVGMTFTYFAVLSFSMSAFVSSRFMNRFGPVAACTTGLGAIATGLWTLGHAASLPASVGLGTATAFILGAAALYYTGVPLYGPSVPTMLLQCVPSHKRGAVMGFNGAVNTLARIVSPLVMGEIHRVRGAGACFKVASLCVYTAVALALVRRWLVIRKMFGKPTETTE